MALSFDASFLKIHRFAFKKGRNLL